MRSAASWSTPALALAAALFAPACRSAAVDEPPRTVTLEQTPPRTPGTGELAIGEPLAAPSAATPPRTPSDAPPRRRGYDPAARGPAPELGTPCSPAAPAPNGRAAGIDTCGTKGRVALVWEAFSSSLATNAPCTMASIKSPRDDRGSLASACLKDGRLWASTSCVECRLPGWSATALVAELTREQALMVQQRLGLPAKEPLLTAEAWSKALAGA
jgi:hypothetical protein